MKLLSFFAILCLVMASCNRNPAKPELALPIVNAGTDTTVSVLDTIVLNGSFSGDSIAAFSWAVGDNTFDTSSVRIIAPESACTIIAVFRTENEAGAVADSVTITVTSDTIVLASTVTYSDDSVPAFYSQYIYDSAGRQIRQTRYKPDSTVSGWTDFIFGNNLLVSRINTRADSLITARESLFYNMEAQNIRIEIRNGSGTLLGYDSLCYDGNGRNVSTYHFGPDGALWYSYVFLYNSSNRLERKTFYSASGVAGSYTIFVYNSKGRLVTEESYSGSGVLTGTVAYTYGALHKLLP